MKFTWNYTISEYNDANAPLVIRVNRGFISQYLIHEGFRYEINQKRATGIYWRCWRKDCRSTIKTKFFDTNGINAVILVNINNNNHTHLPEDDQMEEAQFLNAMKDSIVQEPTTPIKRVYNQTVALAHQLAGANGEAVPRIPDFHNIRSSLSRTKALQCPPIPRSINQVQISGTYAHTFLGERYLLHLDNAVGVAIFATDIELGYIGGCNTLYVDGTFRTAPFPYKFSPYTVTVTGELYY